MSAGVTTHCAFVEPSEPVAVLPEEDDEEEVGELSPFPPQLPSTPTAIIEPSAESAPRRPSTAVSTGLDIAWDPPGALHDPPCLEICCPEYRPAAASRLHGAASAA